MIRVSYLLQLSALSTWDFQIKSQNCNLRTKLENWKVQPCMECIASTSYSHCLNCHLSQFVCLSRSCNTWMFSKLCLPIKTFDSKVCFSVGSFPSSLARPLISIAQCVFYGASAAHHNRPRGSKIRTQPIPLFRNICLQLSPNIWQELIIIILPFER